MALRPPQKIALLTNAYTAEIDGRQRHFVAHPVESGPQACLIEVTNSKNHTLEIVDALIVVPAEVASGTDALPDPLYACWLGVIRNFYKTDRNKFLKSPTIQALMTRAETEHPFRPVRQSELFENAAQLLKEWSFVNGSAPPHIAAQTWLAFTQSVARAGVWYTQPLRLRKASEACLDQWRILSMWESWEGGPKKKSLTWKERLDEYLAKYPRRPPKGKVRGRTSKVSDKPAAFKKRCEHMGLVRGIIPPKRSNQRYLRRFATK